MQGARFGFAAGGRIGAARFGFELEAGNAYDEFLDPKWKDEFGQPMDPDVAKAAAFAAGTINAGLEVVGLEVLLKSFPGLKQLKGALTRDAIKTALRNPSVRQALKTAMAGYGKTLSAEVATEVGQRAVTILAGELGKYVDDNGARMRTSGEIGQELGQEAIGALQAFAIVSGAGPTTGLARDVQRAKRATAAEAFFTAIDQGVTDSATVKRSPAAAQEFFQRVTKDGPVQTVYIEAEPFSEYLAVERVHAGTGDQGRRRAHR